MKPLLAFLLTFLFLIFQPSAVTLAQDVDENCPPQVVFNWLAERQKWHNATDDVQMADEVELRVVGQIPFDGTGIRVTGDGVVVGDSRWVPIVYGTTEGWVNSQYLAEESSS